MSTLSRRPHNLRQPVSCAPCRQRKIRCSRNGSPCDACRRRKCAHDCHYQQMTRERRPSQSHQSTSTQSPNNVDRESVPLSCLSGGSDGTAASAADLDGLDAMSFSNHANGPSDRASKTRSMSGALHKSKDGYIRFAPAQSHLHTLLESRAEGMSSRGDNHDSDELAGFPFGQTPMARAELIAALPAARQCTNLKDVYFKVFSPVGFPLWT